LRFVSGRTTLFFGTKPDICSLAQIASADGKAIATIPSIAGMEAEFEIATNPDLIVAPSLAFPRDPYLLDRENTFSARLLGSGAKDPLSWAFVLVSSGGEDSRRNRTTFCWKWS
jgi:hypothetical protein